MLTLGTQRDLSNDMLIKGIIDSVVTVNQFYQMLPFKGISGNALAYNREEAGVDQTSLVNTIRTGVTGINKDQQKFTRHSTELTTLIGDAQVNGLVQAVGSDFHDATAVQVAAKAKGIGRSYMNLLINGNQNDFAASGDAYVAAFGVLLIDAGAVKASDNTALVAGDIDTAAKRNAIVISIRSTGHGLAPIVGSLTSSDNLTVTGAALVNVAVNIVNGFESFDGLAAFTGTAQDDTHTSALSGEALLGRLDRYIDSIHDKDGMVDYMMLNSRGVRKITNAFRQLGDGFTMMDIKTSSGGVMAVQSYRGVPIFRNDFIESTAVQRAGVLGGDKGLEVASEGDDIYIGTLDDGSMTHGICGLTATKSAGMQVQKLGAREDVDADITRVKWYCGLAHFSELGLVRGTI